MYSCHVQKNKSEWQKLDDVLCELEVVSFIHFPVVFSFLQWYM